jgi:hypothetical protein
MHKTEVPHRAFNPLRDFMFCGQVISMRVDPGSLGCLDWFNGVLERTMYAGR